MARPSDFTQEMADHICERLAEGESLRSICVDEMFPGKSTVFRWLASNKDFRDQYARARETQADAIADEILNIADDAEDAAKARVQIDARKWLAGKLRPKVYGDKQSVTVSGDDDADPISVIARIERVLVHK
jgi:methionine synthase II (cobalamin-independent)